MPSTHTSHLADAVADGTIRLLGVKSLPSTHTHTHTQKWAERDEFGGKGERKTG